MTEAPKNGRVLRAVVVASVVVVAASGALLATVGRGASPRSAAIARTPAPISEQVDLSPPVVAPESPARAADVQRADWPEASAPAAVAPRAVAGDRARAEARPAPDAVAVAPSARQVAAQELEQAGPFGSVAEEAAFWQQRLQGEKLTLENRSRSFGVLKRALEAGALSEGERGELERRRAALEAKLGEQTERVAVIEERVGRLGQP